MASFPWRVFVGEFFSVDEFTVSEFIVGELTVAEFSVGELTVAEFSVGELTVVQFFPLVSLQLASLPLASFPVFYVLEEYFGVGRGVGLITSC